MQKNNLKGANLKRSSPLFLLILATLLFWQCSDSGTNPPNPQLTFSADPGVIEAWLTVTAEDADGMELLLTRDGVERMRFATMPETTVVDTGLLPNHSYNYQAELRQSGKTTASQSLTVTTMDTTSHEFSWEIIEFPSLYGGSVLLDVAIIDENDIWAVGAIYSDSANPSKPYNAVHWDGQQWELKRIRTNACGGVDYPPIETVFAFSANDVLFAHIDGSITRFNGDTFINDCSLITQLNGSATKMWGRSRNDLYVVSGNGFIAHYNGTNWKKMESDTDLALLDIWGVSESEVYAVGLNYGQVLGVVLRYDGAAWQKMIEGFVNGSGFDPAQLFQTQLYGTTDGVWLDERGTVYTVGNLMYQYQRGKWDFVRSLPENYINGNPGNYYRGYLHAIRGNASNDVFIFGQSGTMIHFNGVNWRKIGPAYIPRSDNFWFNCDVIADLIIAVGETGTKAQIIKLWR